MKPYGKMTWGRKSVLKALATSSDHLTAADLRHFAPKRAGSFEWANPHLRWGRKYGLIETCGKHRRRALHRITEAGRRALEDEG